MTECSDDDEGYDIPHPLWNAVNRQKTFGQWTNPHVNIASLASAGFIYVGPGDKVKCVFCYLIVDQWFCGESPFLKHIQLKPNCPHIEYLQEQELPEAYRAGPNEPVKKFYESLDTRIQSFENWPSESPILPKNLAEAGFFYTNERDKVQCFFCGLYAECWEPNDDVYVEHCRLNPKCSYMIMKKGKTFVDQCKSGATATEPSTEPGDTDSDLRQVQIMKDTLSLQGFNKIYIDCAFLQQRIRKDLPFVSSEALFNAILKLPRAEEAASKRLKNPNKTNDAEVALMKTCKMCLQQECKYVCIPCKHFTCCKKCKDDCRQCPICEQYINFENIDIQNLVQKFVNFDL